LAPPFRLTNTLRNAGNAPETGWENSMRWCRLAFFAVASMLVSAANAQTTITFRFNDPEAPQMRQALDAFEKANPDIKVTLQRVSWSEAQQQYLREAAVGSAPDVAQFA